MLEGGIRALVRRNRLAIAAELVAEPCDDALIAGATSIADIDKLMGELQTARNYLQSEGEQVRRMTARYAHLAQNRFGLGEDHSGKRLASGATRRWGQQGTPGDTPGSCAGTEPSGRSRDVITDRNLTQ